MLKSFRVYLKNGSILTLAFHRFEYDDEEMFTIYDSTDTAVDHTYLFLKHIAAIIPEEQTEGGKSFNIYLINGQMFEVHAHYCSPTEPSLSFFRDNETEKSSEQIKDIYVAFSEVAAILPRGGLDRG